MSIQKVQLYAIDSTAGSSVAVPLNIDTETRMIPIQLYALKTAGGSSSVFPVSIDVDDKLK